MSREIVAANRGGLVPNSIDEAQKYAEIVSKSQLVPAHFKGKPADCFMAVNQAVKWGMDVLSVMQCMSIIHGKPMYEGKLVAAVVNAHAGLDENLDFEYKGSGSTRSVIVKGKMKGTERTVEVSLADVKTSNSAWRTQPDQQLAYAGSRIWARRHSPEVLLGVYAPEEFEAEVPSNVRVLPRPVDVDSDGVVEEQTTADIVDEIIEADVKDFTEEGDRLTPEKVKELFGAQDVEYEDGEDADFVPEPEKPSKTLRKISTKQVKMFYAKMYTLQKEKDWDKKQLGLVITAILKEAGVDSANDIPAKEFKVVLKNIEDIQKEEL